MSATMKAYMYIHTQDRSWIDWEEFDYQKAAAAEELTRAQSEVSQLQEDKALLEAKVSQLTGALRALGYDPTDYVVGASTGFARSRNIDSPTLTNTINASWLSPQHHSNTMHGGRGVVGIVPTGGATNGSHSGAAALTSVNSSRSGTAGGRTIASYRSKGNTLQHFLPESMKGSHTQQGGTLQDAQTAVSLGTSLPGGMSYAELLSESTTKESVPQHGAIRSSQNSSDPPDPAECAPPCTACNPGSNAAWWHLRRLLYAVTYYPFGPWPDLLEEVKQRSVRLAAGRWKVGGMMWLHPMVLLHQVYGPRAFCLLAGVCLSGAAQLSTMQSPLHMTVLQIDFQAWPLQRQVHSTVYRSGQGLYLWLATILKILRYDQIPAAAPCWHACQCSC